MADDSSHASPHRGWLLYGAIITILGATGYAIVTGNDGLMGFVGLGYLVLLSLVVMSVMTGFPFGGQMRGGFS